MRKRNIITNNKEIYEKLSMLHFSSEVVSYNVKTPQIEKILKNVNKKEEVLDYEELGDKILIKKLNPINFNIYLR